MHQGSNLGDAGTGRGACAAATLFGASGAVPLHVFVVLLLLVAVLLLPTHRPAPVGRCLSRPRCNMSSLRPFTALDLFRFNATNLDPLTENYDISFYLNYLARWPTYFYAVENAGGRIMGYSIPPVIPGPRPPLRIAPNLRLLSSNGQG